MHPSYRIRPIAAADDRAMAHVIRTVMPEFGAGGAGFAIHDPEVDAMHTAYAVAGSAYFVVESDGRVMGGGGIGALEGEKGAVCELRKMYFLPELRGRGAGRALMQHCLQAARELGYRQCYIETLTGMDGAQALYLKSGFRRIPSRMGATGHFGCNLFYLRELETDSAA
jgi:putative acetyltransferase